MKRNEVTAEVLRKVTTDGRKTIKTDNVKVRNLHITDKREEGKDQVMLSFTTDKEFDTYRADETGVYQPAKTNVIFPSYYGVASVLREDPVVSGIVDYLLENDAAFTLLMNNANITVIQEPIAEGEVYNNPYSANQKNENASDHNWFAYHIDKIELSDVAKDRVNRLIDKMLGI